jgi:hypothetical protein
MPEAMSWECCCPSCWGKAQVDVVCVFKVDYDVRCVCSSIEEAAWPLGAPVKHSDCIGGFGFCVGNELLVVRKCGAICGAFVKEDAADAGVETVKPV